MLQLTTLDETDDNYCDGNLSFGVVASNHELVAEFSSTTNNASIKINPQYPNCNLGFLLSASNYVDQQVMFSIGEIVSYSNCQDIIATDLVIQNHNVGINNVSPAYTLDVSGTGHISSNFTVDGVVNINSNIYVNGTLLQIPIGSTSQRPDPVPGSIRYNTDMSTFEGYGPGNAWGSLGGVINVAQDTYIKAEEYPGATDDNIRMVTCNVERLRITNTGLVGISTSNPLYTLHVEGSGYISENAFVGGTLTASNMNIIGLTTIIDTLTTQNSNIIINNLSSAGAAVTVIQDTTNSSSGTIATFIDTSLSPPVFIVKDGGNVGINTSSPSYALDVWGTAHVTQPVTLDSNLTVSGQSVLANTIIESNLSVYGNVTLNGGFITSNLTVLGTTTTINSFTTENSNVIIKNNSSSGQALAVYQSGVGGVIADFYNNDYNPTTPIFRIADGGNVGINTSTPNAALDVTGAVHISSNLKVGGTSEFDNNVVVYGNLTASNLQVFGSVSTINTTLIENSNLVINNYHLAGSALVVNQLNGDGTGIIADFVDSNLNPAVPVLRIHEGGSIGINNANPAYTVDVCGTGHYTSNLTVDGTIAGIIDISSSNQPNITSLPKLTSIASLSSNSLVLGSPLAPTIVNGGFQVNGNAVIAGTLTAARIRMGTTDTVTSIVGNLDTILTTASQRLITTLSNVSIDSIVAGPSTFTSNVTIQGDLSVDGTLISSLIARIQALEQWIQTH
jgi:hypothetical protein